jgi:micrococcal nuclease
MRPSRRPHPTALPVALAVLAGTALLAGTGCGEQRTASLPPGHATVVTVIDGDTIEVRVAGRRERVRLIGIDTPETMHPSKPVECFGPEASARAAELLPAGSVVLLQRDVEARDRYDRLLAYVTAADGTDVNLALVQEGYAEAYPFPPNVALDGPIAVAEASARAERRGMWGTCGPDAAR